MWGRLPLGVGDTAEPDLTCTMPYAFDGSENVLAWVKRPARTSTGGLGTGA